MAISIGINGFGRIGRVALRIAISRPETFKLCGINARNADLDYMVYMIRSTLHLDVSRENLELMNTDLSLTGRRFLSSQKVMLLPSLGVPAVPNTSSMQPEHFARQKKQVLTCKVVQKKSLFLHLQKMKKHLHSSWESTIPVIRKICPLCPMLPARPTVWHLSVKYWKTIMELNMV